MNLIIAVLFLLGAAQSLPLSEKADNADSSDAKDSQTLVTSVDNEGSEALVASDDADKDLTKSNLVSSDQKNGGSSDLTQAAQSPDILQLIQQQGLGGAAVPGIPVGFGLPVGLGLSAANTLQGISQLKPAADPATPQGINSAVLASILGGQQQAAPPQLAPSRGQMASPPAPLLAALGGAGAFNSLGALGGLGQQQPALGALTQPDLATALATLQAQRAAGGLPTALVGAGVPNPLTTLAGLGQQQPALGALTQPDLATALAALQAGGLPTAEDEEKFGTWGYSPYGGYGGYLPYGGYGGLGYGLGMFG